MDRRGFLRGLIGGNNTLILIWILGLIASFPVYFISRATKRLESLVDGVAKKRLTYKRLVAR